MSYQSSAAESEIQRPMMPASMVACSGLGGAEVA
jgi:hypothetical protein